MNEIISNFKEISSKDLFINTIDDKNKIIFKRSPELIYGLRNFVGNAVKFSKTKIEISVKSDMDTVVVVINDDGPGFPEDVIDLIGEPYIKSKINSINVNAGTGLGTFLGKTLLERTGARLFFQTVIN